MSPDMRKESLEAQVVSFFLLLAPFIRKISDMLGNVCIYSVYNWIYNSLDWFSSRVFAATFCEIKWVSDYRYQYLQLIVTGNLVQTSKSLFPSLKF